MQDEKYVDAVLAHVRAWFVNEPTRMNPNLLYAQAIKGITTAGVSVLLIRYIYGSGPVFISVGKLGVLSEMI